MIFDDNFLNLPSTIESIQDFGADFNYEINAKKILDRPFYFDDGDEYKHFYDTQSFITFFETLNQISSPELLIKVKSFSDFTKEIELSINGFYFLYKKDDTRYSDDYICDKINVFLQQNSICRERFIEFLTRDFTCVGFMSIETYEEMKKNRLIHIMDGVDDKEHFW